MKGFLAVFVLPSIPKSRKTFIIFIIQVSIVDVLAIVSNGLCTSLCQTNAVDQSSVDSVLVYYVSTTNS